MNQFLTQIRQKLNKPTLFGLYGALGCLIAALLFGEGFLALTKTTPSFFRPAQAIALLIDCSGSMDGDKLQEAKNAAIQFVQRQDLTKDQFTVLGFGSDVHLGTPLTSDPYTLETAIANLSDGGGTMMDIAINAAADQLQFAEENRHLLLFTDGIPGSQGTDAIEEANKTLTAGMTAKNNNINLIAVATGDADVNFLTQLTQDRDRVFYASTGDFDRAFRAAEEAIYGKQLVESEDGGNYPLLYSLLRIGIWTGLLAIGTSLSLILGQNHYLHRRLLSFNEGILGFLGGLGAGVAAGAIGQLIYAPVASFPPLAVVGRVAGWAILGTLVGGGMSFFVPNLKSSRALLAGLLGGIGGAMGFLLAAGAMGDIVGRLLGAAILGAFLGVAIALIEQLSREAWLVVHWSPVEQTKISLGDKPVILGSSQDAHVYLRKDKGFPAITATIFTEKDKIIMQFDDKMRELKSMKKLRHELNDGDRRKLGDVLLEVKTLTHRLPN
ncbi:MULTISPECIES: vWA domain-containing protein [unclassified Spirulina]|uniref:vWA domain-containing protein n=1 Tax=unclassified Spirulina TaxID=2684457 RepID=UPI00194FA504|nr:MULTISPECIES: vWA domain-containing protein [Spirulina]MEA5470379.1 vWA domain-containing protein [Spirulina sp. 06S082]